MFLPELAEAPCFPSANVVWIDDMTVKISNNVLRSRHLLLKEFLHG